MVDDSFACHVTDGYNDLLSDPSTVGIFLGPSKQILIDRMTARQGPFDEVLIGLVNNVYEEVLAEVDFTRWHLIDNSDLAAEETADRIIQVAGP